jgi:DNA modification methylase
VTQRVIEGDCLEVLPTLEAGSVDAVVCDPPYGQTNESYDGPIAFSPDVWRECYRVAKDNAALLAFTGSPTYHRIASAIEAGGWKVRQMWAWVYRDGMITSAYPKEGFDRLAPAMDPIVFATKGKVLLNAERQGEAWSRTPCQSGYSERSRGQPKPYGRNGRLPRSIASDGANPFEFFLLSRTHGGRPDGISGHPNQKPLALMRWLVSKLPGGTVLDPFVGSGTTLLACHHEGRVGVGIERDVSYCAIARKRLAEAEAQTPLFAEGVSA